MTYFLGVHKVPPTLFSPPPHLRTHLICIGPNETSGNDDNDQKKCCQNICHILFIFSGLRYDHPCRLVALQNKVNASLMDIFFISLLVLFAILNQKEATLTNMWCLCANYLSKIKPIFKMRKKKRTKAIFLNFP